MVTTSKTLIVWRHGQTDYNRQFRVQGQVDTPLNEVGRTQARAAAEHLLQLPISWIVASPLQRAWITAEAVSRPLSLPVELDDRLRERNFGSWEGKTAEEIKAQWPEDFTSWREWGDPDPERTGVEPRREVGKRVAEAWREHMERLGPGETLLCVSHGSACTQGITELLGIDPSDWFGIHGMDNCHWAILQSSNRRPGWRIMGYNLGAKDPAIL